MKYLAAIILMLIPAITLADDAPKYALLDFTASWCGPCRTQAKTISGNADIQHRLKYIQLREIDFDKDTARVKSFRVFSIPTLILVRLDGTKEVEIARTIGAQPPSIILKLLNRATIVDASSSPSK